MATWQDRTRNEIKPGEEVLDCKGHFDSLESKLSLSGNFKDKK